MKRQNIPSASVKKRYRHVPSETDLEAGTQALAEMEKLIEQRAQHHAPPAAVASQVQFTVTADEQTTMAGFHNQRGDECRFLEWMMGGAFGVLSDSNKTIEGNQVWLLNAMRGVLGSMAPKTPLEAMLISQMIVTHDLQMQFARRASTAKDSEIAAKFVERYARLSDVATRQAETIQRIRGESPHQKTSIENLTVEEGGQAQIGQVNVKR